MGAETIPTDRSDPRFKGYQWDPSAGYDPMNPGEGAANAAEAQDIFNELYDKYYNMIEQTKI